MEECNTLCFDGIMERGVHGIILSRDLDGDKVQRMWIIFSLLQQYELVKSSKIFLEKDYSF